MTHENVIDLFRKNAGILPDHPAIIDGGNTYSYESLDQSTEQLAVCLNQFGVERKELCFVFVKSALAMAQALLGILKSGKIFVPINHDFPDDRIKELIEQYRPAWIILDEESSARFSAIRKRIAGQAFKICLFDLNASSQAIGAEKDIFVEKPTAAAKQNYKPVILAPDDPCYIYFTSGSTGTPKAILGAFKGINHFIDWERGFLNLSKNVRCSQFASPTFDAFLRDLFLPLCSGGIMYIPPRYDGLIKLDGLLEWIDNQEINLIHCVPTLFRELIKLKKDTQALPQVQYVLLSGESLYGEDVQNWRSAFGTTTQLVNLYGPSETTMVKFSYTIDYEKDQEQAIPIGQPISGCKAILLDDNGKPCKRGMIGEIYIRTPYRTLGYYQNETLTDASFVRHPLLKNPDERLYKTGDLAVLRSDGNFEFKGRKDFQVKIRGVRVELDAIASCLHQHEEVEDAVIFYDDTIKELSACIKASNGLDEGAVKSYLGESLPPYMIPASYIFMKQFPTTSNGKTNRRELQAVVKQQLKNRTSIYVAPKNETEHTLANIWKNLLDVERVGRNDNFFELGGHSLLATRVVAAVAKELAIDISIKDIFTQPTIANLTNYILDAAEQTKLPPIIAEKRPEHIPLSYAQERLWFIDQYQGSSHYHIPIVLRLKNDLDKEALKYALTALVERHEPLRTVFGSIGGHPFQQVMSADKWQMTESKDLAPDSAEQLEALISDVAGSPFDLAKEFMFRAHLAECSADEHILLLVTHHIASDGWSMTIMVNDLVAFYQSRKLEKEIALPPLAVQYADYSIWQRRHFSEGVMAEKMAWWTEQLKGLAPLSWPTDFPRPAQQSTRGNNWAMAIPKELKEQLNALSFQQGTTLFMTLLTTFKIFLYRYSGLEDICVGTPVASRHSADLETLIGFFINTLALRSDLSNQPTFTQLLQQVKETTLSAYAHQEVPFEQIVKEVVTERDMSRSPLFQVAFDFQNMPQAENPDLGGMELQHVSFERGRSLYDMQFTMTEMDWGLQLNIEYCIDLFKEETIERMAAHFKALLSAVVESPDSRITDLKMISVEEQQQVLQTFNATASPYPADKTIVELFEAEVARRPAAPAIQFEATSLSYAELNRRANQLAHHFRNEYQITSGQIVGLLMDRSEHLLISILAILKAGAAYLPLQVKNPWERNRAIIEDAGVQLLLSEMDYMFELEGYEGSIFVPTIQSEGLPAEFDNLSPTNQANDLAYVMYTSGTTGLPKGTLISHQNVVSLVKGVDYVALNENDRMLSTGAPSFDAATFEYWGMLLNGAELILCPESKLLDPALLKQLITEKRCTKMWFTSGWFNELVENDSSLFEGLQTIVVGGEKLSAAHIRKLREQYTRLEIVNGYGPTENTSFSLAYSIGEQVEENIPIGKPLNNRCAYVLDQEMQLCPVGVVGELWVGGAGVGLGYLNDEKGSRERFRPNPFEEDGRMYKTGDLARWLPEGVIEFLGRADRQVKIRGFRLELGEIEQQLAQVEGVSNCAVIDWTDEQGYKRLVAYVVMEGELDKENLKAHLSRQLPGYMIPDLWIPIIALPLTNNGKLDRKALPSPDESALLKKEYVAPSTPTEEKLADIWKDLLNIEQVGANDNFFELGGHSLLATRLVSAIQDTFSITMSIIKIFQLLSIAPLAAYIDVLVAKNEKEEDDNEGFEHFNIDDL